MLKKIPMALAIMAGVLALLFTVFPLIHNWQLSRFSGQLFDYQLPQGAQVLETKAVCGRLAGGQQGLDYLAAVLLETTLEPDELLAYYREAGFVPIKRDGRSVSLSIEPVQSSQPAISEPMGGRALFHQADLVQEPRANLYYIVLYDRGYSTAFDFRGSWR